MTEAVGQMGRAQRAVAVLLMRSGVMTGAVTREESCCMGKQVLRPGSEIKPRREIEHWSRVAALVRVMRKVARRANEDVEGFILGGVRGVRLLRKGEKGGKGMCREVMEGGEGDVSVEKKRRGGVKVEKKGMTENRCKGGNGRKRKDEVKK